MQDQIIAAYMRDFLETYSLVGIEDSAAFEHFVNYCIVSKHHPDHFDPEDLSVGGSGDLGLDGLAILVNDHLVFDIAAVDHLKKQLRRLDVQFIFIQSKRSHSFDGGDISTFALGVPQFFQQNLPQNASNDIRVLHKLKEQIFEASIDMDKSPICRLYYVTQGKWTSDPALKSLLNQTIADLQATNLFSDIEFSPIDSDALRNAYREIHNKIVREMVFEKHTILPGISGVQEAYIGAVPCTEYLKLLITEDGSLNRRLFYDNVRDFQGHNPVNTEIRDTLLSPPTKDRFALLNNGVTIVARDINKVGATFKLKDYQIVNGCQTSHILYLNKEHLNEKVYLPIKLIVTADPDVTNKIIQGTNRQTEVRLEAFESLAPFQKRLEEYYLAIGRSEANPLYYERRSKQYDHLESGKDRIVTLSVQINCFVAMFLNEPHSTHRYYGELLTSYRNRLFNDSHSAAPYYVSAAALITVDRLLNRGVLAKHLRSMRYQILMVFRVLEGDGEVPALNSRAIEKYCNELLRKMADTESAERLFTKAAELVQKVRHGLEPWREPPGRTRAFTSALLDEASAKGNGASAKVEFLAGRVKWFSEVRGYGFVTVDDGTDVFLHQSVLASAGRLKVAMGQPIQVAIVKNSRGMQAVDVRF
ncbi:MAG TPA: AIPR family protein [Bauldia sp.]|nr:AIPR family protein [Bauldia sp.]